MTQSSAVATKLLGAQVRPSKLALDRMLDRTSLQLWKGDANVSDEFIAEIVAIHVNKDGVLAFTLKDPFGNLWTTYDFGFVVVRFE